MKRQRLIFVLLVHLLVLGSCGLADRLPGNSSWFVFLAAIVLTGFLVPRRS